MMKTHYDQDKVTVEPDGEANACVIWLHGLGADGHDFEAIVPELAVSARQVIRFVFPHAPKRPVTINNGYVMRAWYDILAIDKGSPQDEEGIRDAAKIVLGLIDEQNSQGIPCSRIVLAGFSQGGAIALHAALRHPESLAGVMALSTYLPLQQYLPGEIEAANRGIAVFMAHGSMDDVVPPGLGEDARECLRSYGCEVEWKSYAMPHSVCADEVVDINQWLEKILKLG